MGDPARSARAVMLAQSKVGLTDWRDPFLFAVEMYTEAGFVWPGDEYSCKRMGWWVQIGDAKVGGPKLGDMLYLVDGAGIIERVDLGWYHVIEAPFATAPRQQRVQRTKYSVIGRKVRGFVRPGGFLH